MRHDIHTREHLLNVGFDMFTESGLRSITVRKLAQRAGVNSGVFAYHFGTRDNYLSELLERWYAPLFTGMQIKVEEHLPPLESLRSIMLGSIEYVTKSGRLIAQLITDAKSGEQAARHFASAMPMRHPLLMQQAIVRAQQAGCIIPENPLHLLMYLVGTTGVPVIMRYLILGDLDVETPILQELKTIIATPGSASQRFEWALKGISI